MAEILDETQGYGECFPPVYSINPLQGVPYVSHGFFDHLLSELTCKEMIYPGDS